MWPEVSRINLLQLAPVLQVPVFFFLGRHDHWVPAETSVAYFDTLTAPSKRLLWFEESGHEAFVDEPEKFNRAMIELVRPVVEGEVRAGGRPARTGIDHRTQQSIAASGGAGRARRG
jgi:hypothetical protein